MACRGACQLPSGRHRGDANVAPKCPHTGVPSPHARSAASVLCRVCLVAHARTRAIAFCGAS
eukprot:4699072-Alexandrium_andersonii.AAC.1